MPQYTVTYVIDIEAETPEAAARKALTSLLSNGARAMVEELHWEKRRVGTFPITAPEIVPSDSNPDKAYAVTSDSCSCPDHTFRGHRCKHMTRLFG
jgi:hypothetical protein